MSEHAHAPESGTDAFRRYQPAVTYGLERAGHDVQFDLRQAVAANYGDDMPSQAVCDRADRVRDIMVHLSDALQVDDHLFDRPAHTVLLAAVADSWLTNEQKTAGLPHYERRLADERELLADVALMLAGGSSAAAWDIAVADRSLGRRYLEADVRAEAASWHERLFLQRISDGQLAGRVKRLLAAEGPESLLHTARTMLGVDARYEEPFDVVVLGVAHSRSELERAGMTGSNGGPHPALHEYLDAHEAYRARFGTMSTAWVEYRPDGKRTMYLRAPEVYMLLAVQGGFDAPLPDDAARAATVLRHEYGHTQKKLALGGNAQLGVLLEERKAELVAGDQAGYFDIKYLIEDLAAINGVDVLGALRASLVQHDAASAFTAWAANHLGLRATLLLMAGKPLPYDQYASSRLWFADLQGLAAPDDLSAHDMLLREHVAYKGDIRLRRRMADWAAKAALRGSADELRRFGDKYVSHRRQHGIGHTNHFVQAAIEQTLGRVTEHKK